MNLAATSYVKAGNARSRASTLRTSDVFAVGSESTAGKGNAGCKALSFAIWLLKSMRNRSREGVEAIVDSLDEAEVCENGVTRLVTQRDTLTRLGPDSWSVASCNSLVTLIGSMDFIHTG